MEMEDQVVVVGGGDNLGSDDEIDVDTIDPVDDRADQKKNGIDGWADTAPGSIHGPSKANSNNNGDGETSDVQEKIDDPGSKVDSEKKEVQMDHGNDEEEPFEIDPQGETKVTVEGELLEGRQYRISTFTLPETRVDSPNRFYMLSNEAAKTLGYRDSYLFFLKNPKVRRLWTTEEERQYLAHQGLLNPSFKRRPISIVTARSVYREFGHRIVKGGKRGRDDYYVEEGWEDIESEINETSGAEMGESSDAESLAARRSQKSLRWFETSLTTSPNSTACSEVEWLYNCAQSVSDFNSTIIKLRNKRFYDRHSNITQVPLLTQPTTFYIEVKNTHNNSFTCPQQEARILPGVHFETHASHDNDKNKEWIRLSQDWDSKFPLALTDEQHQSSYSLFPTRFSTKPLFIASHSPKNITSETSLTSPMSKRVSDMPPSQSLMETPLQLMTPTQSTLFCGAMIPKSGITCKRLVSKLGEKCLLHQGTGLVSPTTFANSFSSAIPQQRIYREINPLPATPMRPLSSVTKQTTASVTPVKSSEPLCHHCRGNNDPSRPKMQPFFVKCSVCSQTYHPSCTFTPESSSAMLPILLANALTYPWVCNDCKVCLVCKEAGEESKLIICDACDRTYHTFCLEPKLDTLPTGKWLCNICAHCKSCSKTTKDMRDLLTPKLNPTTPELSSYFQHAVVPSEPYPIYLCTYCPTCYSNFEAERYCPVCLHVYPETPDADDESSASMVCCDECDRWVHRNCDPVLRHQAIYDYLIDDEKAKYTCPLCDDEVISARVKKLEEQMEGNSPPQDEDSGSGKSGRKKKKPKKSISKKEKQEKSHVKKKLRLSEAWEMEHEHESPTLPGTQGEKGTMSMRHLVPYKGRKLMVPLQRVPLLLIESQKK